MIDFEEEIKKFHPSLEIGEVAVSYTHLDVYKRQPFTIVMPPPNITGQLHMGHALDNTMQDILILFKRMQGYNAPVSYTHLDVYKRQEMGM